MLLCVQNEKQALPNLWNFGEELPIYEIVFWLEHFQEFVRKNCCLRSLLWCYICSLFSGQINQLSEVGIRYDVLKVIQQAVALFEFAHASLKVVCLHRLRAQGSNCALV